MSYNEQIVKIKKCYGEHFYWPQYTKRLLDNYHEKMKKISELVNVLYRNVDSILVTESDFNKLKELGWIHKEEFGKFKEEHVFTEFAIKTPRKWIGICEDGSEVRRPKSMKMSFKEFVKNI